MMDRIIRHITENLVSKLPEGDQSYRLKDLAQYDFPDFLIRRIYIELIWNLDESMQPPETDWADTQSETVQQAWQSFLEAIHAQARLPQSYAKAIVETAVADIIDMLVQPRRNINGLLFGGEDQLSAAELHERTELLVVYAHFSRVLERYIRRKDKNTLTREHCQKIIRQVDAKVTANYTPLQWAQMLDPLFTLAGPQVETDLFRLFFEDREMNRTARIFDMMDDSINRATFIEVLSSPQLLNYDGYEEDQSELFSNEEKPKEDKVTEDFPTDTKQRDEQVKELHDTQTEQVNSGQSTPTSEIEINTEGKAEASAEPETQAEHELARETAENEREEESASLNDIFATEEDRSESNQNKMESSMPVVDDSDLNADEEEATIWSRFMGSDDIDDGDDTQQPSEIPEVQAQNEHSEQGLHGLFSDNKTYYIDELFGGSETAYDRSLDEISQCASWKEASTLIRKDIFERHDVDIYSEAALEFTDRLQTYFTEKNNRN